MAEAPLSISGCATYFPIWGALHISTYLRWKIRQAEKGKIRVGPRQTRRSDAEFKVLPLRMEAELVTRLDEARERLGLTSRMELFRRSLNAYLTAQGEAEVAALFAPEA